MTLTQLEYIIAVDTWRHFAIAAEKCFVTQPTLSMQIKKLETELGVEIFDRSRHPVVPTETGRKIIDQARITVQESKRINEVLLEQAGMVSGELRLGLIPTIAPTLLPRFLGKIGKKYPELRLRIQEATTAELVDHLHKDRIDAAIMATPIEDNGLHEEVMYYEPFMAFIPEGHRLAGEAFVLGSELDINDILLLQEGHCFRNSVINICRSEFKKEEKQVQLESGSFETLVKLSRQGFGMTLIPYLKALEMKGQKDKERIKSFAAPKPTREISMVYRRARLKQALIHAVVKEIKDAVPEQLLEMPENGFVSGIY